MKNKFWLVVITILVLLLESTVLSFADVVLYDMEPAEYYVYVATPDGGLNMRHGPGSDYTKVMDKRIPDDAELYIKYVSGKWGYTTYEGNEGWVYLPQTTTTPPSAVVQPSEENIDVKERESIDPMQENKPSESAEKETEKIDDSMISTILLVACLLFVVVILSVILLIIINLKKR